MASLHAGATRRSDGDGAARRASSRRQRNERLAARRTAAGGEADRPAAPRARALAQAEPRSTADLMRTAGVGAGVVRGMANAGLLVPALLSETPPFAHAGPGASRPDPVGRPASREPAALRHAVAARAFSVTLLDGVTGSGKTEVYLEAVAECLRQGRQALVLLPEIALSSQWLERFERRFGVAPAVWHSDLSSRMRRTTWRAVAEGAAPVVVGRAVGAVPAVSRPGPGRDRRGARDRVQAGGWRRLSRPRHGGGAGTVLPARRRYWSRPRQAWRRWRMSRRAATRGCICRTGMAARTLPQVAAIDLRETPPERGRFLAPPLIAAVQETLGRGEQAMLFLNRRGYAPLTLCRHCGHRMQCPNCTAWLVEHRTRQALQCHHCGHSIPIPPECPSCGAAHSLTPVGPGVERITEEAAAAVPGCAAAGDGERHAAGSRGRGRGIAQHRRPRGGSDHRHADRRQGLAFSASDPGRRGGCRSWPGRRRPARGGTDGAAAAPGCRPCRAGGGAGARAAADLQPGASGDAGAGARRPRCLHGQRGSSASPRPLAALRAPGGA